MSPREVALAGSYSSLKMMVRISLGRSVRWRWESGPVG